MKKQELRSWGCFTRALMDRMELRDWTAQVDYAHDSAAQHNACVTRTIGRKSARIVLYPSFAAQSSDAQAQTIAHELVHLHLGALDDQLQDLEGILCEDAFHLYAAQFERLMEFGVDALADVIATHVAIPLLESLND